MLIHTDLCDLIMYQSKGSLPYSTLHALRDYDVTSKAPSSSPLASVSADQPTLDHKIQSKPDSREALNQKAKEILRLRQVTF